VHIDEVKELGLAYSQGSAPGIRRWPLVLALGQLFLQFIAPAPLLDRKDIKRSECG
jgi:hypothetical protein